MGRPKATETRTRQLNLSLTERELECIKKRASALGMRPALLGRALILSQNNAPIAKHDADGTAQRLIYTQLARLGNNLNQMVRHLHRTDDPLPADLEPLLRDIRHIIARRMHHDR
jgi:YD repeat-containing protein